VSNLTGPGGANSAFDIRLDSSEIARLYSEEKAMSAPVDDGDISGVLFSHGLVLDSDRAAPVPQCGAEPVAWRFKHCGEWVLVPWVPAVEHEPLYATPTLSHRCGRRRMISEQICATIENLLMLLALSFCLYFAWSAP